MNRRRPRTASTFMALTVTLVLAGCADSDGTDDHRGAHAGKRFEAELGPVGASGVTGTAVIRLDEESFAVDISATGLEPGAGMSQHINSWWDCTTIGRILVNLDTLLTVPGEGPARGDDYPRVDEDGRLTYAATRPVAEVAEMLHEYRGMILDELDLENRTVLLRDDGHRPIACGEIRPAITP